jgi:signal transduction histidine kinase
VSKELRGAGAGHLVLRALLGAALFVAAGCLGRLTIIDGRALSLIWPAAGIAGLWIGSGSRRTLPVDLAALALATFTVNVVTGAEPVLALILVVTNLAQVCVFVVLVRRWVPALWGFGGTAPLQRLVDLGQLTFAAVLGCLTGALLGALGMQTLLHGTHVATFLVWWGRNSVAVMVVVTLGLLVLQPLATSPDASTRWRLVRTALRPASVSRLVEAGALVCCTVGLSVVLFADDSLEPLAFLLLVTSVWAGIRFPPLAVTLHGVAMGAAGVGFTLAGEGPFVSIENLYYRALVSQVFVAMTVLTGLALAFSRVERDRANCDLAEARRSADDRARLLDAVLESMKEGVVVVEEGGRLLVHNSASRELAGLVDAVPDHVREAGAYGLFHPNGLPLRDEEMANVRALAGETVAPFDVHVRTPEIPEGRVLEISGQPLVSDDPSSPLRAMVNLRDVTLDRQHRDTLASFAGVVAHDLFNPLTVLDGWTEALGDEFAQGAVTPVVGEVMVTRIQRASKHMRDFIADLMSYTIARDQSLRYGPVDLTATVRALAAMRAEGPNSPQIVVEDRLQVWADTGLVRQLLDNLIGNAIKYVEAGTRPVVEVTGTTVGDWLEVRVSDNGVGIPEHQREAIFENFHRAHSEGFGGSGLGLAICRRIVDRHGGTIHVVPARRGTGSTFVFRLPRIAAIPGGVPEPAPLHVQQSI